MARYSGADYVAAFFKSVFGFVIAVLMGLTFDSIFLFLITVAFFVFMPFQDEEAEQGINSLIFGSLLIIILFLSGLDPPLGLGFEVGGSWEATSFIWPILIMLWFGVSFVASIPTRMDQWTGLGEMKLFAWASLGLSSLVILLVLRPWTWSPVAIIFSGFWIIAALAGSAGDIGSRHALGVIFVTISLAVFASQAGANVVGEQVFGAWWPDVNMFSSQVFGPITDVFSQFGGGFSSAWQLITNPAGFAQSMLNGTYQRDPTTGLAGAYGVDIEEFRVTPIYLYQPFQAVVKVNNKGSFEADNVNVGLMLGGGAPDKLRITRLGFGEGKNPDITCFFEKGEENILQFLGLQEDTLIEDCWQWVNEDERLLKTEIGQVFFPSKGATCEQLEELYTGLVSKETTTAAKSALETATGIDLGKPKTERPSIPLKAYVEYDYSVDSQLPMEFISRGEWDRLLKEGKTIRQAKKAAALTNAPVQLNIDALEQPIREGTSHFVGVALVTGQKGGVLTDAVISIDIPVEITGPRPDLTVRCTMDKVEVIEGGEKKIVDREPTKVTIGDIVRITWKDLSKTGYSAYCQLDPYPAEGSMTAPTKTLLVTARANYTFQSFKEILTKVEFGGGCCTDGDCPGDQKCSREPGRTGTCGPAVSLEDCDKLGEEGCKARSDCMWVPSSGIGYECTRKVSPAFEADSGIPA